MKSKLPVFPNWYPYNDMVFDGHLQIGDCAVKTRSWNWNYRGPVLFYTSGRVAHDAVKAYGYERNPSNHKVIIGVADLAEVRPLAPNEARKMVLNFNNWSPQRLKAYLKPNGLSYYQEVWFWVKLGGLIRPYPIGFFFKNPKRFKEPVPFNWPSGPIRPIFKETKKIPDLQRQLSLVGY